MGTFFRLCGLKPFIRWNKLGARHRHHGRHIGTAQVQVARDQTGEQVIRWIGPTLQRYITAKL
jgi:hypothetical protein